MFSPRLLLLLSLLALAGTTARCRAEVNAVINMSHYDLVEPDFVRMKKEGIVAVIHEATYPPNTGDEKYAARQEAARRNGLLWGAYHFANASDPVKQADQLLGFVSRKAQGSKEGVLLVLDFEKNEHYPGGTMNIAQAAAFAERIRERTGKYPGFYASENRLRVAGRELAADARSRKTLEKCWLWVANYHYRPVAFPPWGGWDLWQYTGDGIGDLPRTTYPSRCANFVTSERNIYSGSVDGLRSFWSEHAWQP